ncbi:hypothetical protein B0H11DRAFT_1975234 [Mycena galericulata]|nr:hypothetical protein B0H11DRAFT_1985055 [Mycena galericulata]KAJ7505598.1 hypothetical protein B0H11DRAFT_1975234 [Mycena galericulata]
MGTQSYKKQPPLVKRLSSRSAYRHPGYLGLSTSHCMSTTVRMAGNLGWKVFLPRDATATFECSAAPGKQKRFDAETMYEVLLTELHGEFATVVTTQEVLVGLKEITKAG